MLRHYIRMALRGLRRAPGYTTVVATSLAATLALVAAVLAVVDAYVVSALPYPESDRLYHVAYAPPGPQEPRGMTALDWRRLGDVVEHAATSAGETFYIGDGGPTQSARALRVSQGFIAALGVRATIGRPLIADDFNSTTQPPALIGQALWHERFAADPNIVGRELRVDVESRPGVRETFRIVGILPPGFWAGRDSRERVDVMVPLLAPARTYMIRLRPGVSKVDAERRLTAAAREIGSAFPPNWPGVTLESMRERYVGGMRATLRAVVGAALLLLLITCTNVAVLTLLRAMNRQREMAVRLALGARRSQLLWMFFVEVGIVCGGALLAGLAASAVLLRVLSPVIERQLGKPSPGGPGAIGITATVLLVAAAMAVVVSVLLAAVSLLAPSARRIPDMLRRAGRSATDAPATRRLRAAFVSLEIAGSLALLVGGSLMIRSAVGMLNVDLGYRTEQLIRARVSVRGAAYRDSTAFERFYELLTARLSTLSTSPAAFTRWPPFYDPPPASVARDGGTQAETPAPVLGVSPGFFTTLAIDIEAGRAFTDADRLTSEPVAIVSRSLAQRLWPGENPIGQRLRATETTGAGRVTRPARTVVGVVRDVRQTYADVALQDLYIPYSQSELGRFGSFYLRTDVPPAVIAPRIRAIVAELDPMGVVTDPQTVVEQNLELSRARFMTSLLAGFSTFALFVALLGVYGVIAYAVRQREREVAIRVALGATGRVVVSLFVAEGGRMLAVGIGLGLLAAFSVGRLLEHQLFGVKPLDVTAIAVACGVMLLAGFAAVWWPARRAGKVAPMTVLNET